MTGLIAGFILVSSAMAGTLAYFVRGTGLSALESVTLFAAGSMLALGGMILLLRQESAIPVSGETDSRLSLATCHLSGLTVWLGVPLGHVLFPYLIWRRRRFTSVQLNREGIACLNFGLSLTLYLLLSAIMLFAGVGFFMLAGLFLTHLISALIGACRAWQGQPHRYPLTINILSPNKA